TSVVSYLRQRPGSNVVAAARQVLTHRWWRDEKKKFAIYSSQFVMDEAASGHTTSAPDWQITLTAGSDSSGPAESSETRSVATHVSTP
ncbi:MAG: hypothetical protein ACK5EN_16020, partial [Planctomyces sp.]